MEPIHLGNGQSSNQTLQFDYSMSFQRELRKSRTKTVGFVFFLMFISPSYEIKTSTRGETFVTTPFPYESFMALLPLARLCSMESIANRVDIQEITKLIIAVAHRKKFTTAEIIQQIENVMNNKSNKFQIIRNIQSLDQSKRPGTINSGDIWKLRQQVRSRPNPPMRLPPSDATISVFQKGTSKEHLFPPMSFAVIPLMTMTDALQYVFSREKNPDTYLTNVQPLTIRIKQAIDKKCLIVDGIGNYTNNDGFFWELVVMDGTGQIMSRGPCIPGPDKLFVLPGTQIHLIYTSIL